MSSCDGCEFFQFVKALFFFFLRSLSVNSYWEQQLPRGCFFRHAWHEVCSWRTASIYTQGVIYHFSLVVLLLRCTGKWNADVQHTLGAQSVEPSLLTPRQAVLTSKTKATKGQKSIQIDFRVHFRVWKNAPNGSPGTDSWLWGYLLKFIAARWI